MRGLLETPTVFIDDLHEPLPQFHQMDDAQKVQLMANSFFEMALETCQGSAIETTRLGITAAGHFAGVVFGSLHAGYGPLIGSKRKKAQADFLRAFIAGETEAKRTAAEAAAQGEG